MQVTEGSHYLAYVLDDECRENLLSRVVTRHEVQVCHHVTIQFIIKPERLIDLQKLVDCNPKMEVRVLVESDTIDFFLVFVDGKNIETDQSFTHLTYSRKGTARNRDSNRVIKGELDFTATRVMTIPLSGRFELVPY